MSETDRSTYRFESELRQEAARILDDVTFRRAPIQSRLLKYLVERAVNDGAAPTQYEIAVDGLGKSEDYDVENDSYPRVQISRLRRNLENYYARNLPGEGLRLQLDSRSYRLMLAPVREPADALQADPAGSSVAPRPASAGASSKVPGNYLFAAIMAIAIIGVAALLLMDRADAEAESGITMRKPSTSLSVNSELDGIGSEVAVKTMASAQQIAFAQLRKSFVSRHRDGTGAGQQSAYTVNLALAPQNSGRALFVSLTQIDGDVLYSNTIPVGDADDMRFTEELKASLIYMTSPTGAIAQAELLKQGQNPQDGSDYACFLNIENRRSSGGDLANLLNTCLERYPDSEYRAFWYARRAFMAYQAQLAAGDDLVKSGPGWENLRLALEADRFNAFANSIAAKIEVAMGHCHDAQRYLDRAVERGDSYPVLIASARLGYASCADSAEDRAEIADQVGALASFNRDPEPLLQMYMVMAFLAADDREAAADQAEKALIEDAQGPVVETIALLRGALDDPASVAQNRAELTQAINAITWDEQATQRIVDLLASGR